MCCTDTLRAAWGAISPVLHNTQLNETTFLKDHGAAQITETETHLDTGQDHTEQRKSAAQAIQCNSISLNERTITVL